MKKLSYLFALLICFSYSAWSAHITKNYVQVYGEAPKGRIPMQFDAKVYTEQETVLSARNEAFEFLAGMVYGYDFVYAVENPLLNVKGHFDLKHIARIKADDPNVTVTQLEESQEFMRVQALYRLNGDQKLFINGFRSQAGQMTMGDGYAPWTTEWSDRITGAFKNAVQNAVLNAARRIYQSRPQYITGKLILRETPKFNADAGQWHCHIKADLVIDDVSYRDQY
ncbi:MAG: hypothetical protein IKQ61_07510 [Spirochaetales bacterium]|nr:hypothetical protein [Spirochaetales bacterium]MBR6061216.1 hypothetical protein [Spirochaetales bacterium]MBR6200089.1 hypothetical protein [Spirochaetales bacterium]